MGIVQKTVFISYRRTNFPWALAIYQNLKNNGFDVFFDYQSLRAGDFEKTITENIKHRAHFLVLLTPSALERCKEPDDWLRKEIELAIDKNRNIVPLIFSGFDFYNPQVTDILVGKLEKLGKYNGLEVPAAYFFEAMDRLRNEYLNVAVEDVVTQPLSIDVEQTTETELEAANQAAPVEKEQLTAQEWFEQGFVFYENNNTEQAEIAYRKAIELDEKNAYAYTSLGLLLLEKGHPEDAEEYLHKGVELDPNFVIGQISLGILFARTSRQNEAEQAYNKAIELDPNNANSYYSLGVLLQNTDRLDEAEDTYRKAIEFDPNNAKIYSNLGILLLIADRLNEAEDAYRKAIEFDPNNAKIYSNLGVLLLDADRLDEAEDAYRKAIELDPNYAMAYYNLGNLLANIDRHVESEQAYRKAIELNPNYAAPYNLACLKSLQDENEEAFEYLEKAILKGFDLTWAWQDPDLENLRKDPRFEAIVGPKPEE